MPDSRLILKQAELGPMANFVYLIGCPETKEAAVVDPAWDVPAILSMAREADLRITRILATHGHPDHINGLEELLEATDATVHMHSDEIDYVQQVAELFQIRLDFMRTRTGNFSPVRDGDEVRVGNLAVRFLHTPGHTPGSQCFLIENRVVSGDTLFVNACGRVDLPGGDPEKMWRSLNHKLAALDDDAILLPGHNYSDRPTSTMGEQKRSNPYMQYASLNQFLQDMRDY